VKSWKKENVLSVVERSSPAPASFMPVRTGQCITFVHQNARVTQTLAGFQEKSGGQKPDAKQEAKQNKVRSWNAPMSW
jgi:hypothetical protein